MIITKTTSSPKFPQLRGGLNGIKFPAIADFKLDGELQYVVMPKSGCSFCVNKYGGIKRDFPSLKQLSIDKDTVLVAELYLGSGGLGRFYDMQATKNKDVLQLYPFDMLKDNGEDLRKLDLVTRLEHLVSFLKRAKMPSSHIKVMENHNDVHLWFREITGPLYGMEGIVVKNFDEAWVTGPCNWVKMKWKDRSDYEVILLDQTKERIEVKVPNPNSGGSVRVGVKAPNRYKKHITLGDIVTIEHQGVLKSGSLRHPVLIPKKGW